MKDIRKVPFLSFFGTSSVPMLTSFTSDLISFLNLFRNCSATLTALDIDGGTDIGAALSTSDLIIVDDGAGGTNRKAALSRVVSLAADDATALAIALG